MRLDERIERDEENARLAAQLSGAKKVIASKLKEANTFTDGPSDTSKMYSAYKQKEAESYRMIAQRPFHAMLELEMITENKDGEESRKSQLVYANEITSANIVLKNDSSEIIVFAWTHPAVQLGLSLELKEEYNIHALGYKLVGIKPFARGKFFKVVPNISGLYEPGGKVNTEASEKHKTGLKAVKLDLTREQVEAFISKMNGMMLVTGAPGSGKTTVAMQRIRFLYDQQDERKDELNNIKYSPDLTRIFLANKNLISYSKEMLEKDLHIPSYVVIFVSEFISSYLRNIWIFKNNAKVRGKSKSILEERGRQAFFGLCNGNHLKGCWYSYEKQIIDRIAQAESSSWLQYFDKVSSSLHGTKYNDTALQLVKAFEKISLIPPSNSPNTSNLNMDHIYAKVERQYERLRSTFKTKEHRNEFDNIFQQWLYWVYDPLDGVISYFSEGLYEGGVRIKKGIASKMRESEIIDQIKEDWENRNYGKEQEPWIAFLLRFSLPVHEKKFRLMPNPISVSKSEDGERWSHVMIDEAQDLSVPEAAILSSFVHPEGAFTVSADFNQVVSPVWGMEDTDAFKIGTSLKDRGQHTSYPFAKNMRQTKQIGLFLQSFYQSIFGKIATFSVNDTVTGNKPLLLINDISDFPKKIMQRYNVLERSKEIGSIALLQVNEDKLAMEQLRARLEDLGVELAPIWAAVADNGKLVTTSVERIKGLEYDACIIIGLDDIENTPLNFTKNRAYVAVSRPAKQLTILCEEFPRSLQRVERDLVDIR